MQEGEIRVHLSAKGTSASVMEGGVVRIITVEEALALIAKHASPPQPLPETPNSVEGVDTKE